MASTGADDLTEVESLPDAQAASESIVDRPTRGRPMEPDPGRASSRRPPPSSIGLVLASIGKYNPGMAAVNRVALSVLSRVPEVVVFQPAVRLVAPEGPRPRELLGHERELLEFDRIVYWGDWLHMANYHRTLGRTAPKQGSDAGSSSPEAIRAALLLTGADERRLEDVAIVGTTLTLDSSTERWGDEHAAAVRRLHAGAGFVAMRDAFSSSIVDTWRGRRDSSAGVDCAFLYSSPPSLEDPRSASGPIAGHFLGRTRDEELRSRLARFTDELIRATGALPIPIPWMSTKTQGPVASRSERFGLTIGAAWGGGRRKAPRSASASSPPNAPLLLDDLMSIVRRCSYVVTDTYHLAVLAWGHGVPCVLFGHASNANIEAVNGGQRFLGLDKRFAMLETIDALPFFVPIEDLARRATADARSHHLREVALSDPSIASASLRAIDARRAAVAASLERWLGLELEHRGAG